MTTMAAAAALLMTAMVLSVALAAAGGPAAASETYGLVIGIDNYTGAAPKLEGAVNDARDVADALTKSGAREVRLLLDQGATRDNIMAAWNELLGKARKDDILLFHYAGHGGQEPEHVKGSEESGYDSTLLLAGFEIKGPGTYERIVDDELGDMFKRASDAGINVLVAIDACHSGTMTRAFETPTQARPRVRAATYPPIPIYDDHLPPFNPAFATIPDDLPNVIYFGAVQDDEEAPEITIDGRSRGALSWALAEGLRGAADTNHDGIVTKEELQTFVRENIRMKLEGRQHPSVIPVGFRSLRFPVQEAAVTPAPPATAPTAATVTLAIAGTSAAGAEILAKSLSGVRLVEAVASPAPTLTWEIGRRQLWAGAGNVIADFNDATRGIKRIDPAAPAPSSPTADGRSDLPRVQAAIDKWRQATPLPPAAIGPLSLALINAPAWGADQPAKTLRDVTLVAATADPPAMLTWDVGRQQVFTALGDLVAEFGPHQPGDDPTRAFKRSISASDSRPAADGRDDLPKLQGVIDTWHTAERIKRLAESRSLNMALQPDDKLHTGGAKITFVIDGHNQTYFTLFNLASDGTVNFLYPLNNNEVKDPLQIPLGRPYTVPLVVDAPFGSDHLVAIASAQPLTALHKTLQDLDGKPMAATLETELLKQLDGQTYQIGIHGSYTAAAKP